MKYWTWEDMWVSLLVALIIAAVSLSLFALFQPHNVDYYYLAQEQRSATCVYAHWTWHADEVALCTDDRNVALDFATRATAALKGR